MLNVPVVLFVGLIGSGKSTVLHGMKERGVSVILTDDLWKQVVYQESNRQRLVNVLGEDVLLDDGSPNLAQLRKLFFSPRSDEQSKCSLRLKKLFAEFGQGFFNTLNLEIQRQRGSFGVTMVIVENALALIDGWGAKILPHHIVSLHCPKDVRLSRILKRNPDVSEIMYLAIMETQPSDENHLEMSLKAGAVQIDTNCSIKDMFAKSATLYEYLVNIHS